MKKNNQIRKNPEIKAIERKAKKINKKEADNLINYFYGDFNQRTGDIAWWYFEYLLIQIINDGINYKNMEAAL